MEAHELNLFVLHTQLRVQQSGEVIVLVELELFGLEAADGTANTNDEDAAVCAKYDRLDMAIVLEEERYAHGQRQLVVLVFGLRSLDILGVGSCEPPEVALRRTKG